MDPAQDPHGWSKDYSRVGESFPGPLTAWQKAPEASKALGSRAPHLTALSQGMLFLTPERPAGGGRHVLVEDAPSPSQKQA